MFRLGLALICLTIVCCNNKKSDVVNENGFSYEGFTKKFSKTTLPYQLSDTSLFKTKDSAVLKAKTLTGFISDSLKNKLFGRTSKVKYIALCKFQRPTGETYFIVKGVNGNRRAVFLLVFDKNAQFATTLTFLNPIEPRLSQVTSIDKSFSVSINRVRKKLKGAPTTSRNVYQYSSEKRKFQLILTDAQGEDFAGIINPIDSFSKKNKLSGDYIKNNRNFISIRDGRRPNQLLTFIHLENENGCSGEFKGELLLASSNTAIYRHGGDPCVLSFKFTPPFVTLREDEGCGSYRGLDCLFEGSFRKKLHRKLKRKRS